MILSTRELTIDDFSGRVGKTLETEAGGHRVALTLDAVQALPHSVRQGGSFRLELRGPLNPMLAQGVFPFKIGREMFAIFLVPLAREANGVRYEAIFY